jgi:hypothetical protein
MARITTRPPDGRKNRIEAVLARTPADPQVDVDYEQARFTVRLALDSKLVRIEDAAERAGISSGTMLTAVTGVRSPNAKTRAAICAYAEELRRIGMVGLGKARKRGGGNVQAQKVGRR